MSSQGIDQLHPPLSLSNRCFAQLPDAQVPLPVSHNCQSLFRPCAGKLRLSLQGVARASTMSSQGIDQLHPPLSVANRCFAQLPHAQVPLAVSPNCKLLFRPCAGKLRGSLQGVAGASTMSSQAIDQLHPPLSAANRCFAQLPDAQVPLAVSPNFQSLYRPCAGKLRLSLQGGCRSFYYELTRY
jgi:hypothetical protein